LDGLPLATFDGEHPPIASGLEITNLILVYNLVYFIGILTMTQLSTIGSYETKTHLADLLRRVREGQGFTITQRGEPVADLLPAGAGVRRLGAQAAIRMQHFMAQAPTATVADITALIQDGRD